MVALSIVSLTLGATAAQAQERDETKMNQLSARPIDDQDILMKKALWRRVDLNEKQNLPMFSKNNEITRYLIEAVKAGLLDAYVNDSCVTKLTPEQFHKKLLIPNQVAGLSAEEIAAGFGQPAATDGGWGDTPKKEEPKKESVDDGGWGTPVKKDTKKTAVVEDDGWGAPVKKATPKKGAKVAAAPAEAPKDTVVAPDPFDQQLAVVTTEEEFFPDQLSLLEVKEDWIFDKKRSRPYFDIQTITMMLPASTKILRVWKSPSLPSSTRIWTGCSAAIPRSTSGTIRKILLSTRTWRMLSTCACFGVGLLKLLIPWTSRS